MNISHFSDHEHLRLGVLCENLKYDSLDTRFTLNFPSTSLVNTEIG